MPDFLTVLLAAETMLIVIEGRKHLVPDGEEYETDRQVRRDREKKLQGFLFKLILWIPAASWLIMGLFAEELSRRLPEIGSTTLHTMLGVATYTFPFKGSSILLSQVLERILPGIVRRISQDAGPGDS